MYLLISGMKKNRTLNLNEPFFVYYVDDTKIHTKLICALDNYICKINFYRKRLSGI
jgi:hypothetical protein